MRVLVIDDSATMRKGLTAFLSATPGVECLVVCASGEEALDRLADASPDVVLTDLIMPGLDGADTTAALLARRPGLRVVVHTARPTHPAAQRALDAGAAAIVAKGVDPTVLLAHLLLIDPASNPGSTG